MDDLAALVTGELPAAVALRHQLHADPRLSGDEEDTAEALCTAIGLPAQRIASTGRLLRIGPATGPAIVLRAELDALPLRERSGVSWASTSGVMHACGHDVHCAALAAVARAARRTDLPVGLVILLQPREEGVVSGAVDVLADAAFAAHAPAAVVGVHLQPQLARGQVGVSPGPVNAAGDHLEITLTGHGGHGAYPHRTDDPVLALAQVVVALHHLVSRRVDPLHAAVLTLGELRAGTASNIVPDTASATGLLRSLDPAVRRGLHAAVRTTVAGVAAAYGCHADVAITAVNPVLDNHPALAAATAAELTGSLLTPTEFRSCGADDFAFYSAELPAVMIFVGTNDEDLGRPGLHHPAFAPSDEILDDVCTAYLAGLRAALTVLPSSSSEPS